MDYPVWQLSTLGGGFWVALISTVHVFVAQFAVGGGLFLVVTERMARKANSTPMLDYVRKHSKFFLLLTMVFGAVTGVAIWFSIALLAPGGALTLIHQFVFGWATEWVFFAAEIVSLLVYFYGWDRLSPREHMTVGYLYFFFGWMSLFLINGIIGFMLTPGDWLETRNFWDGFFNPTFWPQLAFRTALSAMLAGLFGFVTGTRIEDETARSAIVRTCAGWTIVGVAAAAVTGWWYIAALPPEQYQLAMEKSARVATFMKGFWIFGPAVIIGCLVLAVRMPRKVGFPLALIVMLLGLGLTGSFESVREAARKPYIIWGYLYSNGIAPDRMETINEKGMLQSAAWVPENLREVTPDNEMEAGRWLYQLECAACHSVGGPMNDLMPKTAKYTEAGFDAFLSGMGLVNRYMPPFAGTDDERAALAAYLIRELHNREPGEMLLAEPGEAHPESFDAEGASHALFVWADKGLRFAIDSDLISLRPPRENLNAQLVLRDMLPEKISEDVTVEYTLQKGFPKVSGEMKPNDEGVFRAEDITVLPYAESGYNPYPLMTVTAKDADGTVLAKTEAVLAVGTRMGCNNCHGGGWKNTEDKAGLADATAMDILMVHDRMNGTRLAQQADAGTMVDCASCHEDADIAAPGDGKTMNLSASIHGFHAVHLKNRGQDACAFCHETPMFRGMHYDAGLECDTCHGDMTTHSASLLLAEKEAGKKAAAPLLAILAPGEEVAPRTAWVQEPNCLACHEDFEAPSSLDAPNHWTEGEADLYRLRLDDMDSIHCAACHGASHAIYPATFDRDNLQPLQYQDSRRPIGSGNCSVCHTMEMEYPAHHPGMGMDW